MHRVVSVFSGCGGLDYGFKQAGFQLTYACDNDPAAVDCYARNIDRNVFVRDVRSDEFHADVAELGNCEVVLGGFPCQGFSKAGPKKVDDERNLLYLEMKRVVAKLSPQLFIAENVDGLTQNFRGSYVRRIITDFKDIGYDVDHMLLDAASFGIPQHRRRIFFVGVRDGMIPFKWPISTHHVEPRNGESRVDSNLSLFDVRDNSGPQKLKPCVSIRDAISDLLELDDVSPDHQVTKVWPKQYENIIRRIDEGQKLCNVRHAKSSVYTWRIPEVFGAVTPRETFILETISRNRRHKKYGDVPNGNPLDIEVIQRLSELDEIRPDIHALLNKGYLKEVDGKYDLKGAMFCSGLFKRPQWDAPAPTVLTNFHNPRYFLHPKRDRPFSLRECARLQTFPDDFRFVSENVSLVDGYRLVGNAVPPQLSALFAEEAMRSVDISGKVAVAL